MFFYHILPLLSLHNLSRIMTIARGETFYLKYKTRYKIKIHKKCVKKVKKVKKKFKRCIYLLN